MSKVQVPYKKAVKAKKTVEPSKRRPKKPMVISDIEKEKLKLIAEKAKKMRIAKKMSYEEFALHAGINRNSYYRFEQSASSGDNYTVALLMKVIIALDSSFPEFFKNLQ
jgi:DNA-binding XRE family transcriptional regulator